MPSNQLKAAFQRGRWGYDLAWICILLILWASPFPFLKTKKEHALEQIYKWKANLNEKSAETVTFNGVARTTQDTFPFSGIAHLQGDSLPSIRLSWQTTGVTAQTESFRGKVLNTLRGFFSIYTHLDKDVFEYNDVWIIKQEQNRVLMYFPSMKRAQLKIRDVYLWAYRDQWLPQSLTLRTEDGLLLTYVFSPPTPSPGEPTKKD